MINTRCLRIGNYITNSYGVLTYIIESIDKEGITCSTKDFSENDFEEIKSENIFGIEITEDLLKSLNFKSHIHTLQFSLCIYNEKANFDIYFIHYHRNQIHSNFHKLL